MKYKVVGFIVWRGTSWYLHRRFPGLGRKLAIGAGAALVTGGAAAAAIAIAAQRRSDTDG